ncbi:putative ABC transport system permease protein [Raineyella antarctica]|uniref:Putative ABC transport system permease protein n=1 Tax=Raineyella antarctica TaxID=1577474 RepID=A0A1G6GFQ2_9ACTN|nr:FtsX-like permease family protein [Raineyella antarctica]SDB80006.1 putative ABC transport system permease protein [Raineyella antarctica]
MLWRMLRTDLRRTGAIGVVLAGLVAIAALLAALGGTALVQLTGSLDRLFTTARTPDIVQMHVGDIDADAIQDWSAGQPAVQDALVSTTVPIPVDRLVINGVPETGSVLQPALTVQNPEFDHLLGMDGQVLTVRSGEIALPVYYALQRDVEVGDPVTVRLDGATYDFRVAAFLRDSTMNPTFVTSKRLLVSPEDLAAVLPHAGEPEYLVEFLLTDTNRTREVAEAYADSGLPQNGMMIERSSFYLFNAISHGIVIAVLALLAGLLVVVAVIALRFSFLTSIERDLREIGVMKAIGLPRRTIRGLYLVKYAALVGVGGLVGLLASVPAARVLTAGLRQQLGAADRSVLQVLVPVLAAAAVVLLVIAMVALVLRRLDRITAMDALRAGTAVGPGRRRSPRLRLWRSTRLPPPVWLGLNAISRNLRAHGMLLTVLTLCTFIMVVPLNLHTTVTSPAFITYMGAGRSDLRLELRDQQVVAQAPALGRALATDPQVGRFTELVTIRQEVRNPAGEWESLNVENGDHTVFPVSYLEGRAPTTPDEMALSSLAASGLGVRVGDAVPLRGATGERRPTVSGIYQDVTNGGRTAKAVLPTAGEPVLWDTIVLDLAAGADPAVVGRRLAAQWPGVQAVDVQEFTRQSLGELVDQTRTLTGVAAAVALLLAFLITAMFATMVIARDTSQIAVQRALGISDTSLRTQYLTRFVVVLLAGVLLGTVLTATLGQYGVAAALGASLGAPAIRFDVDPLLAYGVFPLALVLAVVLATVLATRTFRRTTVTQLSEE